MIPRFVFIFSLILLLLLPAQEVVSNEPTSAEAGKEPDQKSTYIAPSLSQKEEVKIQKKLALDHFKARLLWYININRRKLYNQLLNTLQKKFPGTSDTAYFTALAHYYNGRNAKALLKLNKAIQKNDGLAKAWNLRGVVLSHLEQNEKALLNFQKANHLSPHNPHYLYSLAFSLYKLKLYDQALLNAYRLIEIKPNSSRSYYLQALIHFHQKQYAKSLLTFRLAEEFGEKNSEFYFDYFKAACVSKHEADQLKLVAFLPAKKIKKLSLLRKVAEIWYLGGNYGKALSIMQRFVYKKETIWQDRKRYVYILKKLKKNAKPHIHRMAISKAEKKSLNDYAEKVMEQIERQEWLKAGESLLRSMR